MFSVRNENSWTRVTPGSLWLKFVHSGVCTRARASVSSTSWAKRRSSMTGGAIGTIGLSGCGQRDVQADALAGGGRHEPVGDGRQRDLGIRRIGGDVDRLDFDPLLPMRQRAHDRVLHARVRGGVVRLEQKPPEPG